MEVMKEKTPLLLQYTIAQEIRNIAEGMLFQTPKGDELVPMEVYMQALPMTDSEAYINIPNPWCIVKMNKGNVSGANAKQSVTVTISFGIYNQSLDNQGHAEILKLIQKIYERFAENPLMAGQYTCDGAFEWNLEEKEAHPYYFGSVVTRFEFEGVRRENKYL